MAAFRLLNLVMTLIIPLFLITLHSQMVTSFGLDEQEDDDSEYILDAPFATTRLGSRFLASIKKGTHCNPDQNYNNICNGVSANNGTSLLQCCKTHCRNLLGDKNNCGRCGRRCRMNEKCCNGHCVDVLHNDYHCGRCNKRCVSWETCENGYCGYA